MKIIQITNTYSGAVLELVKKCVPEGFEIRTLSENSTEALADCISDADYILASGRVKINETVLSRADNLKMIQRTGVGLDSLDLDSIRSHNIPVYVNQGINAQSVAEHTVMLILACLRRLCAINQNTKKGVWKKQAQGITTYELSGKTVGVIGMGNIGRKVAGLLNAFGAQVLYFDQYRQSPEAERALDITYMPLKEIFTKADIITLHCPLTEDTRALVRRETMAQMRDGVILVNTARGELVDEAALLEALRSGKVGGAGLDVHAKEPIPAGDPLLEQENVIMTPHVGGVTYDAFYRMMEGAMNNIAAFDRGDVATIEKNRL